LLGGGGCERGVVVLGVVGGECWSVCGGAGVGMLVRGGYCAEGWLTLCVGTDRQVFRREYGWGRCEGFALELGGLKWWWGRFV